PEGRPAIHPPSWAHWRLPRSLPGALLASARRNKTGGGQHRKHVGELVGGDGLSLGNRLALDRAAIVPHDLMRRFLSPPRLSRALPARTSREPDLRVSLPHLDFGGEPRLGPRLLDCISKLGAPRRVALHPEVEGRLRDSRS